MQSLTGLDEESFRSQYHSTIVAYDKGKISDESFIWQFQQSNTQINPLEFVKAWNSMLVGTRPAVLDMLQNLRQEYSVHLLSNINAFHARWVSRYFKKEFDIEHFPLKYFDSYFYSHEINLRKPDIEIYSYVQSEIQCSESSSILFIDDLEENTTGAQQLGWKTITHDPQYLIEEQMQKYLVK